MKFSRNLVTLLALSPASVLGQNPNDGTDRPTELAFQDNKTYRQVGPRDFEFLEGEFRMTLRDGIFSQVRCFGTFNPYSEIIPANLVVDCTIGTNALIAAADLDGDGVRDPGGYISIDENSLIPHAVVPPGRADDIVLQVAPLGRLPRPLGGQAWRDLSRNLQFDVLDPQNQAGFDFTSYVYSRPYTNSQLRDMLREVVPGQYVVNFPQKEGLDPTGVRLAPFGVNYQAMVEAYPGRSLIPGNNAFRLTNDDSWVNGRLIIDPNDSFKFTWNGLGSNLLSTSTVSFAIEADETEPDGGRRRILYPAYPEGVSTEDRFPQNLPFGANNFTLGVDFFRPGQTGIGVLTVTRSANVSNRGTDESERIFEFPITFQETYAGTLRAISRDRDNPNSFLVARLSDAEADPDYDYDGDGYSNVTEFALQTDPFNPADLPRIEPESTEGSGRCLFQFEKRPYTDVSVRYGVLVATDDLTDFRRIDPDNDPDWVVYETETTYSVLSRSTTPSCILRPIATALR